MYKLMENPTLMQGPFAPNNTQPQKAGVGALVPTFAATGRLPEILMITTFPPRQCGIATYSQDLVQAMQEKFGGSFALRVCPIETATERHQYSPQVPFVLNVDAPNAFVRLASEINSHPNIRMVLLQHEFGLFAQHEGGLRQLLATIHAPIVVVMHTVLPAPDSDLRHKVRFIAVAAESIIVMTQSAAKTLIEAYGVPKNRIQVIPHGTHLVPFAEKENLKAKYQLQGRRVLSTFGLLSEGKGIETTLEGLPRIVASHPDVLFLIIGKTHPTVVQQEGERYRQFLEAKVIALGLQDHVRFINYFLPLTHLLDYLQLTDIYLFTSRDPNQAVSGTFSYAISCGCPIVSTAIPHAREVLRDDAGILIDFGNHAQLSEATLRLLDDQEFSKQLSSNGLHRMASTAWENSAIAHALLFESTLEGQIQLQYNLPPINLDHLKQLTTHVGMVQFCKINKPDMDSGYTLDDNARALVALCQHYALTRDAADVPYIHIYFNFIQHCMQSEGYFLNYVNEQGSFTAQNKTTNLADANGRAIWALGYLIAMGEMLPFASEPLLHAAESLLQRSLTKVHNMHSTRAMAFAIKGLYYRNTHIHAVQNISLIEELAGRLMQMYKHEAHEDWQWYESYLTYANSIVPEAMLCAWLATGDERFKQVAQSTFDFLLSKTFGEGKIQVISNQHWLHNDLAKAYGRTQADLKAPINCGGEQPIDVAYTILALSMFYEVFGDTNYLKKMETAFSWFQGNNHLHQIVYNPCTGGCYDGLESDHVNLNQGAESTVSYLMARLTVERTRKNLAEVVRERPYAVPIPSRHAQA
jgi:glycosyltransferase involved in cell wall biosynthesis